MSNVQVLLAKTHYKMILHNNNHAKSGPIPMFDHIKDRVKRYVLYCDETKRSGISDIAIWHKYWIFLVLMRNIVRLH